MTICTASTAFADEPPPENPQPAPPIESREQVLATELFDAARELMTQGRFAEACPKLIESAKLSPKVGTFGKLAECEEKLGQLVSARARWLKAKHLAEAQNDERLSIVNTELARVDALVPKLALVLPKPLPSGCLIRVDSLEISPVAADVPLPLDPGKHAVVVSAPDKKPWTVDVSMRADGSITLVSVPALEDLKEPASNPPITLVPQATPPMHYAAFGALGGGVAGLIAGAFFGGRAISQLDTSNRLGCNGDACAGEAAEMRNEARSAGNVSTALFLAGGLMVAGGFTLLALSPSPEPRRMEQKPVQAKVVASLSGLSIQGRWQ